MDHTKAMPFFGVIHKLQDRGITFLFVSHKLNEVLEISQTIMVMRNGRVVSTGDRSEYDTARLVYEMTGHAITEKSYQYTPQTDKPPLLKAEGIGVSGILRDISFEMYAGEIVGVTGLLGSGRTELALALFGMLPITSGHVSMDGKPITIRSIQDAITHRIGYVPEDRLSEGLFLEQAISNNVVVRSIDRLKGFLGTTPAGSQPK